MTAFDVTRTSNVPSDRAKLMRLEIDFVCTPAATVPITHRINGSEKRSKQRRIFLPASHLIMPRSGGTRICRHMEDAALFLKRCFSRLRPATAGTPEEPLAR